MAPKLPDRYQVHVRLDSDGDIDEWLATDRSLDRPVLIRVLSASATSERRHRYLSEVRSAAAAHHMHLVEVYAVGEETQPYAVVEWHGGVTVADRLAAGEPLPVDEFLPNATGLARGLAALHAAGATHGAIDPSVIGYGTGQPAKLGGYGRVPLAQPSVTHDTAALARTLRVAIVGDATATQAPSQVAEGLPVQLDDVLAEAESGQLNAARLAVSLASIETVPIERGMRWSWGWLGVVIGLVVAALMISAAGFALEFDADSPFLFPAAPRTESTPLTQPPVSTSTTSPDPGQLFAVSSVHDPFGDNAERDQDLLLLSDGDAGTGWQTERYFRRLNEIKDGVGVIFDVAGDPSAVVLQGSEGLSYEWKWAESIPADFAEWEHIARGSMFDGRNATQLPPRRGGVWLLWITDLPEETNGEFIGEITVVQFLQ